jgi:hypothetical protein
MVRSHFVAVCAAVLALVAAPVGHAQRVIVGGGAYYGPGYVPYGVAVPIAPCVTRLCADDLSVRSAIRRELRQQELAREPERPVIVQPGPRYLPPATSEAELMPAYQGSGEVLPQYQRSGERK